MREIVIKQEKSALGGTLMYSLFSTIQRIDDFGEYESYGISITYEFNNTAETERVEDISTDFEFVERLFTIIADSEVYPVNLGEIVYDFLCGKTV